MNAFADASVLMAVLLVNALARFKVMLVCLNIEIKRAIIHTILACCSVKCWDDISVVASFMMILVCTWIYLRKQVKH